MEAGEILTIVKSLSRAGRSCTYHQVDLHVHSPVSHDYSGDSNISPYDFVSAFAARGFDLIAVTDHNTGTFIDKAVAARNWIATEEGKNIAVLPGVPRQLYLPVPVASFRNVTENLWASYVSGSIGKMAKRESLATPQDRYRSSSKKDKRRVRDR